MLSFNENGFNISINCNNKLSISQVSDVINITINHKQYSLTQLNPIFKSNSISELNDDLFDGTFLLNNDISISGNNSIELQQMYLSWEYDQLNRNNITFSLPIDRNDVKSGVAPFHPYFFAVINKLARTSRGMDLVGFGTYLNKYELKFIHQYCTFHPALRKYIALKDQFGNSNKLLISCKIFELLVDNALAHVEGYRDKLRFQKIYLSNELSHKNDEIDFFASKFLMEYDHILDSSSIWNEEFDFFNCVGNGGHLDILNLPF